MKDGTRYATKLKKAFSALKSKSTATIVSEMDDPLYRMAVATFGVRIGDDRSSKAIERLLTTMVDWNEVRASAPGEVFEALEIKLADGVVLCAKLISLLQAIFDLEHKLSLDSLHALGRRQAKQYLELLDGIDEYVVASVILWGLGGHAIPVDDRLLKELRNANLVHPDANRSEVQAFLERHISAADAKLYCVLMKDFKSPKTASTKSAKPVAKKKSSKKKKAAKKTVKKKQTKA